MAGQGVTLYATTAGGNKTVLGSIDWRENVYMPAQINDNVAQIMGDLRALVNSVGLGFVEVGDGDGVYTPTYIAANQFRIDGADVSAYYTVGRRVRAVAPTPGTINGTITAVAYTAPNTLVTVAWDSGSLANEAITAILLGIGSGLGNAAPVVAAAPVYTQCRLDFVSTAIVRLNRCNGSLLTIDNAPQTIPAAGVDLAPTGLGVAMYYIYASLSGGVMVLTPSTNAPVVDPRNGLKVMTGNAASTLVGMAYINTGPVWMFGTFGKLVKSYYNRNQYFDTSNVSGTTGSASAVALTQLFSFFGWDNEVIRVGFSGYVWNTTTGGVPNTFIQNLPGGTQHWATAPNTGGDASQGSGVVGQMLTSLATSLSGYVPGGGVSTWNGVLWIHGSY